MNILIVEDSASMRAFIGGTLERAFDACITETSNGFEALKALPDQQFDAIITDINMPEISGLDLLRYIKEHPAYRHIPVVIVSTEVSPEDRQRGMEAGASAYINKPVQPGELEQILEHLVRDRRT